MNNFSLSLYPIIQLELSNQLHKQPFKINFENVADMCCCYHKDDDTKYWTTSKTITTVV